MFLLRGNNFHVNKETQDQDENMLKELNSVLRHNQRKYM